ncbi:MAG: hypothetical protein WC488_00140 [Candidatus Micrarchaeia archaeon]
MGRIALAVSAFALLLLLGCFTPNMNGPCCKLADALQGTCNLYTQPGPDDPPDSSGSEELCNGNTLSNGLKCTTRFCTLANSTPGRNETIYIKYTTSGYSVLDCSNYSPSNTSHPCNNIGYCFINAVNESAPDQSYNYSVPICTERSEMGIDTDCKTMLCGNIKYSPQHSFLPEPAKNPMYQNLGSSYTINLYNAMCNFYTLDNKTMKKLKKGSGIFVNSYRFGIGESISDFEEGRYYFPLSDRWCGFVPDLPGAAEDAMCSIRDRYMNYLNLSAGAGASYTQTHVSGSGNGQLCTDELIYIMVDYKADGAHLLVTDTAFNTGDTPLDEKWWHDNCQASNPSFIGGKGPSTTSGDFQHGEWHELEVLPGHFEPGSLTLTAGFSGGACSLGSASTTGGAIQLPGQCSASGAQSGTFSYSYDGFRLDFSGDPRRFDPCTLNNRSVCSQDGNLDFAPAPSGQYVMTTFTEGTGQFATSYVMPANRFYKENLLEAYLADASSMDSTEMMDFECSSSGDCLSGLCMKEDSGYERSFCVDSSNGLKNCLCYEVGMRARPGNAVYCEPYMVNDTWGVERATYTSADGTVKDADPILFFTNKSEHGNAIGEAYMNEDNFTQTFLYRSCHPGYNVAAGEGGQKINISDLGACKPDDGVFGLAIDSFLKLDNTYGWCDSCTLATMVGIDLDYYFKKYQRVIPSTGQTLPYVFNCPATTCNDMQGVAVGVMDDMGGCELCGKKVNDYMENLALLRNRVDNYHKAGVIPVVWYVNGTLGYAEAQSGTYETYHNCRIRAQDIEPYVDDMESSIRNILLGNYFYYVPDASPFFEDEETDCATNRNPRKYDEKIKCPSPITASGAESNYDMGEFGSPGGDSYADPPEGTEGEQAVELGWWSYNVKHMTCNWTGYYHFLGRAIGNSASIVIIGTDDMDQLVLRNRSIMLKEQGNCPNCLAAVYSQNANVTKLAKALGCNSPYSCSATSVPAGYYVDVIVYDFRANDAAGADREKAILDASTETSRNMLANFGKPSFPYNFVIDDSANGWEAYNDTLSAMKYLLGNQTDLVNSGQFALFYKKWFRNDNESLVTPMAGSSGRPPTFKDEKFCAIQKAINIYLNPIKRKTLVNEIATVASTSDEAKCVKCTDTEIQFGQCDPACENGVECTLPAGAASHDGYRCQFNTAVEPCTPCANYGDAKLSCTYTYPDDSTSTALFQINELDQLYGDIIASMPKEQRCCLSYVDPQTSQIYNYTYSKSVGEGMTVTPVRFPKSGNESLDCGLNKDSGEFCGVQLPIKDYLIECKTG